jgi:uncharacterized protein YdeI (YjbR/CyaY-like superfamily)
MNKTNPKVDQFLEDAEKWRDELESLRSIVLDCGLDEELKWGVPCYTFEKNNVALLGTFKDNCVLSFFKGALLKDESEILSKPGENTQSGRVIRFTDVREIARVKPLIKEYIYEAVEIEKAGLKVDFKKTEEFEMPEELQNKLNAIPNLKNAFEALTPGRQRAYILYFAQPKQAKTREARITKCVGRILAGKGLNDLYAEAPITLKQIEQD